MSDIQTQLDALNGKTPTEETSSEEVVVVEADTTEAEPLGEGGIKALQAERDARKKAEAELSSMKANRDANSSSLATELETARNELARYKTAFTHGLSADDLEALPVGISESELERLATRLGLASPAAKRPAPDPTQGKGDAPSLDPKAQFAAFIQSNLNS